MDVVVNGFAGRLLCGSIFSTPLTATFPILFTSISTIRVAPYSNSVLNTTFQSWEDVAQSITSANTSILSTGYAFGEPLIDRWQSKDLSLFPTDVASSLAQQFNISNSASSVNTSSDLTGESTSTSTDTDLSTGTKVGIAVGAAVGGLMFVIAGVWLLLRRRKKRRPQPATQTLRQPRQRWRITIRS